VTIVGVSFDAPAANAAFREDQSFQYELWTDTDRDLALYYGAAASASATYPSRVTRILDADGTLVLEYTVANPATHPQQVLEDCQALFGE
jgi:peroxiredoxin